MGDGNRAKWDAFRLVKEDNAFALQRLLGPFPIDTWSQWRNFAGKTLYELAEWIYRRDSQRHQCYEFLQATLTRSSMFAAQPGGSAPIAASRYDGEMRAASPVMRAPFNSSLPAAAAGPPPLLTEPTSRAAEGMIPSRPPSDERFPPQPQPPSVEQLPGRRWDGLPPRTMMEPGAVPMEPVVQEMVVEPVATPVGTGDMVPVQVVKPDIREVVVDVPQVQQMNVVVEVPEAQHHKITKLVPKVNIIEVTKPVEMPVVHTEEDVQCTLKPQQVERQVARTTIREVANPVVRSVTREEEEVVLETYQPPLVERVVERPRVEVQEKLHYVKGKCEVITSEETEEVLHDLTVTREELNLKPEVQKIYKDVEIPYEETKIVFVDREELRQVDVDVPQVTIVKNVKYMPKFEMETVWVPRGMEPGAPSRRAPEEDPQKMWDELQAIREDKRCLEEQSRDLQEELRRSQERVNHLVEDLMQEKRERHELSVRVAYERNLSHNMVFSPNAQYHSPGSQAQAPGPQGVPLLSEPVVRSRSVSPGIAVAQGWPAAAAAAHRGASSPAQRGGAAAAAAEGRQDAQAIGSSVREGITNWYEASSGRSFLQTP